MYSCKPFVFATHLLYLLKIYIISMAIKLNSNPISNIKRVFEYEVCIWSMSFNHNYETSHSMQLFFKNLCEFNRKVNLTLKLKSKPDVIFRRHTCVSVSPSLSLFCGHIMWYLIIRLIEILIKNLEFWAYSVLSNSSRHHTHQTK